MISETLSGEGLAGDGVQLDGGATDGYLGLVDRVLASFCQGWAKKRVFQSRMGCRLLSLLSLVLCKTIR